MSIVTKLMDAILNTNKGVPDANIIKNKLSKFA